MKAHTPPAYIPTPPDISAQARPIALPAEDFRYSRKPYREAQRCMQCECMECVKVCEYLKHYKGYPKKYIREVYNNLSIVMGTRYSNQLINSCACAVCAAKSARRIADGRRLQGRPHPDGASKNACLLPPTILPCGIWLSATEISSPWPATHPAGSASAYVFLPWLPAKRFGAGLCGKSVYIIYRSGAGHTIQRDRGWVDAALLRRARRLGRA